jgi:hypothetical protein
MPGKLAQKRARRGYLADTAEVEELIEVRLEARIVAQALCNSAQVLVGQHAKACCKHGSKRYIDPVLHGHSLPPPTLSRSHESTAEGFELHAGAHYRANAVSEGPDIADSTRLRREYYGSGLSACGIDEFVKPPWKVLIQ